MCLVQPGTEGRLGACSAFLVWLEAGPQSVSLIIGEGREVTHLTLSALSALKFLANLQSSPHHSVLSFSLYVKYPGFLAEPKGMGKVHPPCLGGSQLSPSLFLASALLLCPIIWISLQSMSVVSWGLYYTFLNGQ